jgi:hypothetical protein
LEISLLFASVLNFGLAAIGALVVFPKGLRQPFGEVSLAECTCWLGFYLPAKVWKHIALGVVLALCTLGGMLAVERFGVRSETEIYEVGVVSIKDSS